jgi:hypothetical protein
MYFQSPAHSLNVVVSKAAAPAATPKSSPKAAKTAAKPLFKRGMVVFFLVWPSRLSRWSLVF